MKSIEKIVSQEDKDRINGKKAGRLAAMSGRDRILFPKSDALKIYANSGDRKTYTKAYLEAYKLGYEKFSASTPQKQQERKGKNAGGMAAARNRPRPDFIGSDTTPEYQKAYLEAYDNYLSKKRKKISEEDPEFSHSILIATSGLSSEINETKINETIGLIVDTELLRSEEELNTELFLSQQGFPEPQFLPNLLTPTMEFCMGDSEKLELLQNPSLAINSIEELGHDLDLLISNNPNSPTQNCTKIYENCILHDTLGKRAKSKDSVAGLKIGKKNGLMGYKKSECSNKSSDYIEAYNQGYKLGYEKFLALTPQEQQEKKGKSAGRAAASAALKNCRRPDLIKRINKVRRAATPEYQKAYLEAYANYILEQRILEQRKKNSEEDPKLSCTSSIPIRFKQSSQLRENKDPIRLMVGSKPLRNRKFSFPQQGLPQPQDLPNLSTPTTVCDIGDSEKLELRQNPSSSIQNIEGLDHYLDSLISSNPNSPALNLSSSQEKNTSWSFDVAGNSLEVLETIQPAQNKQPLFYKSQIPLPLLFNKVNPVPQPNIQSVYISHPLFYRQRQDL